MENLLCFQGPPQPYAFSYGVNGERDGGSFGQQEESDGKNVKGSYVVNLPDGRKQVVSTFKKNEAILSYQFYLLEYLKVGARIRKEHSILE